LGETAMGILWLSSFCWIFVHVRVRIRVGTTGLSNSFNISFRLLIIEICPAEDRQTLNARDRNLKDKQEERGN
jgi:hypothetical protein